MLIVVAYFSMASTYKLSRSLVNSETEPPLGPDGNYDTCLSNLSL